MLDKDLIEKIIELSRLEDMLLRQAKTMLAGFIALNERDVDYIDKYADTVLEFMEPESETEMLMRKYYDHIATFNPEEAKRRLNSLENDLGYKTRIVYAAGLLAEEFHSGHKDKGGNDYFNSEMN